jgi:phosphoribosylformylglycinamidine synthase
MAELGAELVIDPDQRTHGWAFGEDQGRYLIATRDPDGVEAAANAANVPCQNIAKTISARELKLGDDDIISVSDLRSIHEGWLPDLMNQNKGE